MRRPYLASATTRLLGRTVAHSSMERNVQEISGAQRLTLFGGVGATGLIVNTAVLYLAADVFGAHYLPAALLATQASTTWNFLLSEAVVFGDRELERGRLRRFTLFWAMNNLAFLVRGPMIYSLTEWGGLHYLASNIVSLAVLFLTRYALSDLLIWRHTQPSGTGT